MVRRGLRLLGWGLVAGYIAFALLVLALRYAILPGIGQHRGDIEQVVSQAVGLPVHLGDVKASWDGLHPELILSDVVVSDRQGRQAVALERVESVLAWRSLWHFRPILARLVIERPVLDVRRDTAGRISIAGVETEGESDPRLADWLLAQPRIRVRNAIIVWTDDMRGAPPLVLEDLQFGLDNRGSRHRFGLSAAPPAALAARIDLRGDLHGDLRGGVGEALDKFSGQLFVELDYADLAGWRAWVDYPVELPQGRGALRVWGDWRGGRGRVTADVALEDLRIRLARNLPELGLSSMRGRLQGHYGSDEWELAGSKVELQSRDGIRIAPTDFRLGWRHDAKKGRWSGNATASMLDLDALARLADFLPLDSGSRELLTTRQPRGRLTELRASWEAESDRLKRYALRARFDGLGMQAVDGFPGAAGLSGQIDAGEKGGSLTLDAKDASLDLPTVFPEPRIPLGEVKAKASWAVAGAATDIRIEHLEFAAPDAAGSARGTYRYDGDGPGRIDLTAELSRADGRAVWRYMPKAVNAEARNWLQRSITAGTASDARLVLKGDLRDFPFRDKKQGEFLVTAKAHGVRLDYAPGWPAIEGIDGTMSFGVGMRVEARRGGILGTQIGPVLAEIPDFESPASALLVRGQVGGPTSEFLRFIEQSPVGDKIDHFTAEMRAAGHGHLDLQLDMPLTHIADTRVRGDYQFLNNQVTVVPGLPPLTQVNGRLKVSEEAVTAPEITAQVLGGPMKLAVKNEGERVNVAIAGTANVREARKFLGLSILDNVTGSAAWKGEVRVRKRTAEFGVESNLVGVSSSLPEPFNKNASSALPLRVEKKAFESGRDGAARDQIRVSLGKVAEAVLVRRQQGETMRLERGVVAVGETLPALPERGVAAAVSVPRLDADAWRHALGTGEGAAGAGILGQISVRAPSMRLFNRNYADVELNLRPREGGWQIALATREAAGDLFWREGGEGWLQADLKRLYLSSEARAGDEVPEAINSLPGLDVRVADFAVGDKHLGRLELKAHNDAGIWNLDSLGLANPEATLKGKGRWSNRGGQHTRLNFDLAAHDLGKLLDRLGYPGTVRRGTARLKGDLAWTGPLTEIDYPTLAGEMKVMAMKGQFAKIEPGIGKLLGLLSLQSLPRRLSLDFRDIFSDGFAFDSIDADLAIQNGIMRTVGRLEIDGPAARILMQGQADLKQETQDVLVTVQPEVGSTVSVGALVLANPAVGAAAVLANKLLRNPLNKIFSFQYHVTGSWSDPKMEKVGQAVQEVSDGKAEEGKKP